MRYWLHYLLSFLIFAFLFVLANGILYLFYLNGPLFQVPLAIGLWWLAPMLANKITRVRNSDIRH